MPLPEVEDYIVLESPTIASLQHSSIVVDDGPEVTIKTMHAGEAVTICKLVPKLEKDGFKYILEGSADGWCFLRIAFQKGKTIRL